MKDAKRRALLYGVGACLVGALLFVGFVVKLPPDIHQLLNNASFEAKAGSFAGARKTLAHVLEREPEDWKALWLDAYCAERLGRDEEAAERYRSALARIPEIQHREEAQEALSRVEGRLAAKKAKSP